MIGTYPLSLFSTFYPGAWQSLAKLVQDDPRLDANLRPPTDPP